MWECYTYSYLCGFVIDTADCWPVCLSGPLSLQIGAENCVQRKSSADGGFRWPGRGSVCFGDRKQIQRSQ